MRVYMMSYVLSRQVDSILFVRSFYSLRILAVKSDELLTALFFFSSRRRHTRFKCDWSSDVCSSDLPRSARAGPEFVDIGPIAIVPAADVEFEAVALRQERCGEEAQRDPPGFSQRPQWPGALPMRVAPCDATRGVARGA